MQKNFSIYTECITVFWLLISISCQGQSNEDSLMKKHSIVIKDKSEIILVEPDNSNDIFCQPLKKVKPSLDLSFRDEDNAAITYFIQIFFTVDTLGKVTFLKKRDGNNKQLKNVVSEIVSILRKATWTQSQISATYVFSCKVTMAGLTNIYLSTENNYMRKAYCE